jgi:uncharacterized membrane protein YhhN
MLTKSEKLFSIIYGVILIAELICDNIEGLKIFHYATKPLVLFSLILFFLKHKNSLDNQTNLLILSALLFSLLGDILLMFTSNSNFFMGGLAAFLMAHIMYILVFLKKKNRRKKALFFTVVLLIYGFIILYFLKDGLGDLLAPVIVYMLVILTMVIMAFLRHSSVSKLSYNLVFLGAILFITSDSLLALNKFHEPFRYAGILIMVTYAIAQFFIVLGLKKQL